MSYIPDYRKDEDKLNETDKMYWLGYQKAIEDAKNNLDNALDNCGIDMDSEDARAFIEEFETFCECSEIETMCSLVESGDYEDVEFEDCNPPLFTGTKGAKAK